LTSPSEGSAIADAGADIKGVTTPNGKMIARMRTHFTQPETIVFPLAAAPMGKGFAGVCIA
jgi:hypothetical protein